MEKTNQYVIRGGEKGRERLRLLSQLMAPTTLDLFKKAGLKEGATGLDLGCGGGDVTLALARIVGENGTVLGMDMDSTKIDLARKEAEQNGIGQVKYQVGNVMELDATNQFDFIYARFLLTHLQNPLALCKRIHRALKKGGVFMVEDIDFSGNKCYPPSSAYDNWVEWYSAVVRENGADPEIGYKLPHLLLNANFSNLGINVVQPTSLKGEEKRLTSITMENIAEAVISKQLTTREEFMKTLEAIRTYEASETTIICLTRVFQVWGYK